MTKEEVDLERAALGIIAEVGYNGSFYQKRVLNGSLPFYYKLQNGKLVDCPIDEIEGVENEIKKQTASCIPFRRKNKQSEIKTPA